MAEPLSKIDRITLVNTGGNGDAGVSRITGEVAKVIAQVPPVVESLTGIKLDQLFERVRGPRRIDGNDPPARDPPARRLEKPGGTDSLSLPGRGRG